MATYYVSLVMTTRPPDLDDLELRDLLRGAIDRAMCMAIDLTPTGFIVEADANSIQMLEAELRAAIEEADGEVDNITIVKT